MNDPLAELTELSAARSDLDRAERRLIETARAQGISWARIASALGLGSRQAAEQRWLRLCAEETRDPALARDTRRRQQNADIRYGKKITELRAAVVQAERAVDGDSDWEKRHPRAELVRRTLSEAASAPPGALFELAAQAVHDLDGSAWPPLPASVASALRGLKAAVAAASRG